MDEMREIVTMEQADALFLSLAVGLPVLGLLVGAVIGVRKRVVSRTALRGFLIGLLGPANLLLWRIYNLITDRLGLDSVKNLLVNLFLFLAIGICAGLIIGRLSRRTAPETPESVPERTVSDM